MKKMLLLLFLAISSVSSYADGELPTDVENYVAKRQGCDHMRGEIPELNQKRVSAKFSARSTAYALARISS